MQYMKVHTDYLTINTDKRKEIVNITGEVATWETLI